MKLLFKLMVLLFAITLCAFSKLPDSFATLLNRAQLTFEQPEGWVEVPVINNNSMHYDYAIKYPGKNFEVRYTVRPMDSMLMQYKKMLKPGTVIIHPNNYLKGALMATMMNIGNRTRMPQARPYDSLAVKREFNADKGIIGMTIAGKEFAQDYQNCAVVAIQKDDVAYAYCFMLFNDQADFKALMPSVLHALKFKP